MFLDNALLIGYIGCVVSVMLLLLYSIKFEDRVENKFKILYNIVEYLSLILGAISLVVLTIGCIYKIIT